MRDLPVIALGTILLIASFPLLLSSEKMLFALGIVLLFCSIANLIAGLTVRWMRNQQAFKTLQHFCS